MGADPSGKPPRGVAAGGASVRDYAALHGLAEGTVRWTLKRLPAKTDCRRQAEVLD